MARKTHPSREKLKVPPVLPQKINLLSPHSKKLVFAGLCLVLFGFWILTYTDPAGQNWASTLSPLLLVLGYFFIGLGSVMRNSSSWSSSASNSSPKA
jgi:hypothetical protein